MLAIEDVPETALAAGSAWLPLLPPEAAAHLNGRLKQAKGSSFAAQVRLFGSAVGCALCVPVEENGETVEDVALLTVSPQLRRRGLGGNLLKRLEIRAAERGLRRLRYSWLAGEDDPGPFAPFLAARGWTTPEAATSRVVLSAQVLSAQVLADLTGALGFGRSLNRFAIMGWDAIGAERRAGLREALAFHANPLPEGLDPFAVERVAMPDLCFAGLWDDAVVCWLMASWTPPRAALVNVAYGLPDGLTARRTVRMWLALAHSVIARAPDAFCWWETPTGHDAMTRVIRHRRHTEGSWIRTG